MSLFKSISCSWCHRWLLLFLLLAGASASMGLAQESPAQVEILIRAGQAKTVTIDLGRDSRPDLVLHARREPLPQAWPAEDLKFEVVSKEIAFRPEGRQLVLRITAEHCSPEGAYEASIKVDAGKTSSGPVGEVRFPVRIQVEPSSVCEAGNFGVWILILLAFALWLYTRGMYFNCRFISPDQLADRLSPLRWASHNLTEGTPAKREEVRAKIAAQLRPARRFLAWLRANPLIFGLPWKHYEEAVRLDLGRRSDDILLEVLPLRNALAHYESNPEEARGKLFATATSGQGVLLFGLADRQGMIGRLRPDPGSEKLARLRSGTRMLAIPSDASGVEDLKGFAAGWQIVG